MLYRYTVGRYISHYYCTCTHIKWRASPEGMGFGRPNDLHKRPLSRACREMAGVSPCVQEWMLHCSPSYRCSVFFYRWPLNDPPTPPPPNRLKSLITLLDYGPTFGRLTDENTLPNWIDLNKNSTLTGQSSAMLGVWEKTKVILRLFLLPKEQRFIVIFI